jgi:hypothetical protein
MGTTRRRQLRKVKLVYSPNFARTKRADRGWSGMPGIRPRRSCLCSFRFGTHYVSHHGPSAKQSRPLTNASVKLFLAALKSDR